MADVFTASEWRVSLIQNDLSQEIQVAGHYLHQTAPCMDAFGLFHQSSFYPLGVALYGTPASNGVRIGLFGEEHSDLVGELTRLWVDDTVPTNGESFLISRSCKLASKPLLVSYADFSRGHVGIVYQAANWLYTGLSAKRTEWYLVDDPGKYCQTVMDQGGGTVAGVKAVFGERAQERDRQRKHRYVYIQRSHRRMLSQLRYPPIPYPKPLRGVQ